MTSIIGRCQFIDICRASFSGATVIVIVTIASTSPTVVVTTVSPAEIRGSVTRNVSVRGVAFRGLDHSGCWEAARLLSYCNLIVYEMTLVALSPGRKKTWKDERAGQQAKHGER